MSPPSTSPRRSPVSRRPVSVKQRITAWLKRPWLIRLAARLATAVLWVFSRSWRTTLVMHPETRHLLDQGQPVLYALWHGRMFCLLRSVDPLQTALLISGSNDGDFITETVKPLGFIHFIRGSSKRDGSRAARGLVYAVQHQRLSVASTVDGPRGPRYQAVASLARLSQQLNTPIVPLTASAKPCLFWLRRSWDHYMGPNLFSHITIAMGQPMYPADADTQLLTDRLNQSTALLDSLNGYGQYWSKLTT